MSLLIYAESADGKFKKVAFELASYAKKVAESWGTTVTAVTINNSNTSELATYGVDKVICAAHSDLDKKFSVAQLTLQLAFPRPLNDHVT